MPIKVNLRRGTKADTSTLCGVHRKVGAQSHRPKSACLVRRYGGWVAERRGDVES